MDRRTEAMISQIELGNRLKSAREKAGMNQGEVAKRLGCSRTSITNYEAGYQSLPVQRLIEIAEIYDVNVSDFLAPSDSVMFQLSIMSDCEAKTKLAVMALCHGEISEATAADILKIDIVDVRELRNQLIEKWSW